MAGKGAYSPNAATTQFFESFGALIAPAETTLLLPDKNPAPIDPSISARLFKAVEGAPDLRVAVHHLLRAAGAPRRNRVVKRDLLGFADRIAFWRGETYLIQATEISNVVARFRKIGASDEAERAYDEGAVRIWVFGWRNYRSVKKTVKTFEWRPRGLNHRPKEFVQIGPSGWPDVVSKIVEPLPEPGGF